MRKLFYLIVVVVFISSCTEEKNGNNNSKDFSQAENKDTVKINEKYVPDIERISDANTKTPFYIINVKGTSDLKEVVEEVKKIKTTYGEAGYLWIPDYESLSGKEMYVAFMGPFTYKGSCLDTLTKYKKSNSELYAVMVSHEQKRVVFYDKFDCRVDGQRKYVILTYAKPEDEDEYFENGGEDWSWFMNDVANYFMKKHEDQIEFGDVYSDLSEKDIKELEKELKIEDSGFGYICIKGNEKQFIPHNPPSEVIEPACDFFGFKYDENWQSGN